MKRDYSERQMAYFIGIRKQVEAFFGNDYHTSSQVTKWLLAMYHANIPEDYWSLAFSDLHLQKAIKLEVQHYLKNIDKAAKRGIGMMFLGSMGVGKTSMMCAIGKQALISGHDCVYTTLEAYIACERDRETNEEMRLLYDKVWGSKFILIDEIDKVYIKTGSSWVPKKFIDLIKGTTVYGKVLVLATNADRAELQETFGDATFSALNRHAQFTDVIGEDFSKNIQNNMAELLDTDDPVLVTDNIKKDALAYHKKQREIARETYDIVTGD